MGKRGNNEGSITKRSDGRWQARITLENGKRMSYYAKTRQEAARLLAVALHDQEHGLPPVPQRQTVAQYLAQWLSAVQPTIEYTTWLRYEQIVRLHLVPALGHLRLAHLTPQHLHALYAEKLAAGLSPTSVHHVDAVLHKALQDALVLGVVQRNVAEVVKAPAIAQREMRVFSPEQARAVLAAAQGDRLEALYVLALSTGMREGELFGLKWRHLDLDSGVLQVQGTLKRTDTGRAVGKPKTQGSQRKIMLSALAIAALRRHRTRQAEERLFAGSEWHDQDLVFCNPLGNPLDPSNVKRYSYLPLLKRAGAPYIRFHDLRHTAATLLLLAGVHPKVVSEMLGHSDIAITLRIYSHVLPDMQQEASAAMDRLLGAPAEASS